MPIRVAEEDYLKLIFKLEQGEGKVSLRQVAAGLRVSAPAVTKMVQKLQDKRMLTFNRVDGVKLTSQGSKTALEVVRGHRLIELFLVEYLNYDWDEVHEEAELLEHVVSEKFKKRLAKLLGYPTHDPHGDPIPDHNLKIKRHHDLPLNQSPRGIAVKISRVQDSDSEMLQCLGSLGLFPGTEITIKGFNSKGDLTAMSESGKELQIPIKYMTAIRVMVEEENATV